MNLSRLIQRRIVYATVLASFSAALWWSWPRSHVAQPVTDATEEATAHGRDRSMQAELPPAPPPAMAGNSALEPKQVEPTPKVKTYKVVSGDTVESIAARFGLKPSSILWSNRLTEDSLLQIDQELLIPATDGVVHVVTEGDSLWEIALAYGAEVDEVIQANPDISPDTLQPGQLLVVPNGKAPRRATMIASRSGTGGSHRVVPEAPSAPVTRSSGLIWPLTGEITDRFGWRTHPVYGTKNYHEGIDIAVSSGTPIRAVAAGRVVLAEWYGGYGLTIKVDHGNGLVSRYSHYSELLVKVGDTVEAGQVIANSGNTGLSTGPHLDFGLYRDNVPIDPLSLLP